MSALPPPPPGSKIQVEVSGDTLRVVIPGRWTTIFWVWLLVSLVFIAATLVTPLFLRKEQDPLLHWLVRLMPLWGILWLLSFAFIFWPRTETLLLGRDQVETRGSFRPFGSRSRRFSDLEGFDLKLADPDQIWQGPVMFYGVDWPERRKLLFATAPAKASPRPPDLAVAVQANNAELVWLRELLEGHQRRLGGQRESSTTAPL
jgi:hypothetical protein